MFSSSHGSLRRSKEQLDYNKDLQHGKILTNVL